MVCNVRFFYFARYYWRMASVATTSVCILCCIPQSGICYAGDASIETQRLASEILNSVEICDVSGVSEQFDKLAEIADASENPLAESQKFLQIFIEELNAQYALNLTIQDACKLIRENIHVLNIPEEIQEIVLSAIELCEPELMSPIYEETNLENSFLATDKSNWLHFKSLPSMPVISDPANNSVFIGNVERMPDSFTRKRSETKQSASKALMERCSEWSQYGLSKKKHPDSVSFPTSIQLQIEEMLRQIKDGNPLPCSVSEATVAGFLPFPVPLKNSGLFSPLMAASVAENDLPSNCYIGGVEIAGGILVSILATIWPPLWGISLTMIGDGARRLADGVEQIGEERRNNPNHTSLVNLPVGYKF